MRCDVVTWEPEMVFLRGLNDEAKTSTSPNLLMASSSVMPTVASVGWEKTALAMAS